MNGRIPYWWIGTFLIAFLAIGVPYWGIPYDHLSLPNSLYGIGLLAVMIAAAIARFFGKTRVLTAILVAGAAVPAAVIVRVAVETVLDPRSHNLWPLEIIIALIVGVVWASMGALAGSFPLFFSKRG
jgi:hypothetical protein